jgi:hypothetical protein
MFAVDYSYNSNDEGAAFVGAAPISDADKAKPFFTATPIACSVF